METIFKVLDACRVLLSAIQRFYRGFRAGYKLRICCAYFPRTRCTTSLEK
jgi:hypothetical protein